MREKSKGSNWIHKPPRYIVQAPHLVVRPDCPVIFQCLDNVLVKYIILLESPLITIASWPLQA